MSAWGGRRVLVTGAGGFIGSHVVERLVAEGASVRALVRYNSMHAAGWLGDLAVEARENVDIAFGDIRDSTCVATAVRGCDVVFHLAALISIPYSYEAPDSFVETNVRGTLNVLQAARSVGGIRVIQTSTSEVYGTPQTVPITEAHPLRAQSPYAASKIAADQLALSFHHTYNLPVTVLRPFNTYGPRQSARAVLPTIVSQLLAGRCELRLGALWPERDLTYVSDTVEGFLKAAATENAIGQVVQLGTGRAVSIGALAELAQRTLGITVEVVGDELRLRPEGSEVARLVSDPTRAGRVLGWSPSVSLEDGLLRTAEWIRANLSFYTPWEYVV